MLVLPPYPTEVTTLTEMQVNHPDNRSPENYVRTLLQLDPADARYRTDKYGTKCNFLVHDAMHLMGYPVEWMLANDLTVKTRTGLVPPFKPMVLQDACQNANLGCPTWAGVEEPEGHGHVVIILPGPPASRVEDLLVMQAGVMNFYGKTIRWSWTAKDLQRVTLFGAP